MTDERASQVRVLQFEGSSLMADMQELITKRGLKHGIRGTWPSEPQLPNVPMVASICDYDDIIYIIEHEEGIMRVSIFGNHAYIQVFATSPDSAKDILQWAESVQPRSEPIEDKISVTFWNYSPHGPRSSIRHLEAAAWHEVEDNYDGATRERLSNMMQDFRPARGGQLLLFTGDAGTGKTHALRALAREWKDWCSINYVVDPESFFGVHADYLVKVLLGEESGEKWRLLVL